MAWIIDIRRTAAKQMIKLDRNAQERIIKFLKINIQNSINPRQYGKALSGKMGDLWRYRVGDYRIICKIEDEVITVLVLAVGHRKDIYSQF